MTKTEELSPGEAQLKKRERFALVLMIVGFVLGFPLGFFLSYGTDGDLLDPSVSWPPMLALAAVAYYVVMVPALAWVSKRNKDELESAHQSAALELAMWAMIVGYPAWYGLWKGGYVAEPHHGILFLATVGVVVLGYLYHRFR